MADIEYKQEMKDFIFSEIEKGYFSRNFGSMMKADIDVMIFSAYLMNCKENSFPCDDHSLSLRLGITENQVRSLKERNHLRYPTTDDPDWWKEEFVKLIKDAAYSEEKQLVQMNISDVSIMNEVRAYIMEKGWFDEQQRNPNLFQCKVEFFIKLCNSFDSDDLIMNESQKKHLQKIANETDKRSSIEKIMNGDYKGGFSELIFDVTEDLFESAIGETPLGPLAKDALKALRIVLKNRKAKKGE